MYKSWFHMELIINSYVMGKGDERLGILILSNTKCRFHVYYIYVDPLSLQILYLKMLYSEGRSGFPWTEPCHRTIFPQIKELEKENNIAS